jgi:hypothetical protein
VALEGVREGRPTNVESASCGPLAAADEALELTVAEATGDMQEQGRRFAG